jgi:ADP-ribosylglycohydrolase
LGCILGQAIGDAIGAPVEFQPSVPKNLPGLSELNNRFTDDTQMMAAIAEALLASPPHLRGEEEFMGELGKRFMEWQTSPLGGSHRGPGRACMAAAYNLSGGMSWKKSGGLSAKGNGSAMRSSVVGAFYSKNLNIAWEIGCMTSVPTHNNLEPILCAGVVSVLCAAAITGVGWSQAFQDAIARVENWRTSVPCYPHEVAIGPGYSNQDPAYVAHHLKGAFEAAETETSDGAFTRGNGDDFATVPATAAAIFFNTRYENFRDITENCATWTNDCDTTTAIAGAIAGSRLGAEAIPEEWRSTIEMSEYFHDLADRICLSR